MDRIDADFDRLLLGACFVGPFVGFEFAKHLDALPLFELLSSSHRQISPNLEIEPAASFN